MSDWQHFTRMRIEQAVGEALVDAILRGGWGVAIHDGEDFATIGDKHIVRDATDYLVAHADEEGMAARKALIRKLAYKELRATDQDTLYLYEFKGAGNGWQRRGSILLVYGNDGTDVISDYSANPETEAIVRPIMDKLDKIEKEGLPCDLK